MSNPPAQALTIVLWSLSIMSIYRQQVLKCEKTMCEQEQYGNIMSFTWAKHWQIWQEVGFMYCIYKRLFLRTDIFPASSITDDFKDCSIYSSCSVAMPGRWGHFLHKIFSSLPKINNFNVLIKTCSEHHRLFHD